MRSAGYAWRAELMAMTAHIGVRPLHDGIGGRTVEDVGRRPWLPSRAQTKW